MATNYNNDESPVVLLHEGMTFDQTIDRIIQTYERQKVQGVQWRIPTATTTVPYDFVDLHASGGLNGPVYIAVGRTVAPKSLRALGIDSEGFAKSCWDFEAIRALRAQQAVLEKRNGYRLQYGMVSIPTQALRFLCKATNRERLRGDQTHFAVGFVPTDKLVVCVSASSADVLVSKLLDMKMLAGKERALEALREHGAVFTSRAYPAPPRMEAPVLQVVIDALHKYPALAKFNQEIIHAGGTLCV